MTFEKETFWNFPAVSDLNLIHNKLYGKINPRQFQPWESGHLGNAAATPYLDMVVIFCDPIGRQEDYC